MTNIPLFYSVKKTYPSFSRAPTPQAAEHSCHLRGYLTFFPRKKLNPRSMVEGGAEDDGAKDHVAGVAHTCCVRLLARRLHPVEAATTWSQWRGGLAGRRFGQPAAWRRPSGPSGQHVVWWRLRGPFGKLAVWWPHHSAVVIPYGQTIAPPPAMVCQAEDDRADSPGHGSSP
jgi:hypothetical protein